MALRAGSLLKLLSRESVTYSIDCDRQEPGRKVTARGGWMSEKYPEVLVQQFSWLLKQILSG